MPEVFVLPYELVDRYHSLELDSGGVVPLKMYMSKTKKNGGNDNCHALFNSLRWKKEGGTGPKMNTVVGGREADILLKGQDRPQDFLAVWNFMCRNKEALKKIKLRVALPRSRKDPESVVYVGDKERSVYDLYFDGASGAEACRRWSPTGSSGSTVSGSWPTT